MNPRLGNNQLIGTTPDIHYIRNKHHVIVATDTDSLQLLTVYSQFEKLRLLDRSFNVETANKWPVTVAVNARTKKSDSSAVEENNAFYHGGYDAYLFAPYTQADLPLTVNAGVLAHEHFHSLFQHLVIDPIKDKYPDADKGTAHNDNTRLQQFGLLDASVDIDNSETDLRVKYHAVLLRGLNEGLADVWGWVFTGDEGFVGRSLRGQDYFRNMGITNYRELITKTDLMTTVSTYPDTTGVPYQICPQVSRLVKNLMEKHYSTLSETEIRQKTGELVVKFLPVLKDKIASLKAEEYLTLTDIVATMTSQITDLTQQDCQFLNQLLPSSDRQPSYHCGDSQ